MILKYVEFRDKVFCEISPQRRSQYWRENLDTTNFNYTE
jgi:hypothetical protein